MGVGIQTEGIRVQGLGGGILGGQGKGLGFVGDGGGSLGAQGKHNTVKGVVLKEGITG